MQSANPLVGDVYQAGSSAPTPFPTLLESMKTSDVIYLGETHDNPFHHHIEQQVIFQLIDQGLRPAVGFEFFSREQTSHLLRYRNGGKKGATGKRHGSPAAAEKLLRVQLGWEGNRERDWQRFLPILRKVRELQLPVFGADLSAGLKVSLTRHGYDGLNGVEKMLVTRTTFDDPGHRDWMAERLRAMHCGWGDDVYIDRLYQTWLARNEAMAESIVAMVRDNPGQPVVVIMGGGHLEYNLGVYERVQNLMPEARQLNIRMQQVIDELTLAADYFEPLRRDGRDYGPRHDYLWFTSGPPRREHSCADMHMKKPQAQAARATADP
ncbi:MAG: ChaN family lipoprotein [Gammaproteobacteria bacterium]|nr:ChaN family lipoprotein [Gammaproteobacteria bacterium]